MNSAIAKLYKSTQLVCHAKKHTDRYYNSSRLVNVYRYVTISPNIFAGQNEYELIKLKKLLDIINSNVKAII